MAKDKKDEQPKINMKKVNKLRGFVQSSLDKIYSSTYFSTNTNKNDLDQIKTRLDDSIDNIIVNNKNLIGKATMSSLYSRVMDTNLDDKTKNELKEKAGDLESLFNNNETLDNGVTGWLSDSTNIYEFDNKIDTILKYMPKLEEALDCKKDNVLSADHFSKDFINVINNDVENKDNLYSEHIKFIKKEYDFLNLIDEIYEKTAKYGEQFVYIVPTKKAIARLMNVKNSMTNTSTMNVQEGYFLNESTNDRFFMDPLPEGIGMEDISGSSIRVELNKSGMLTELAESELKYMRVQESLNEMALSNDRTEDGKTLGLLTEAANNIEKETRRKHVFDDSLVNGDDISMKDFDNTAQEGLFNKNLKSKTKSKTGGVIDLPGSIVKILPRKNVIPLYIQDKCFGYYYIETESEVDGFRDKDIMQDPTLSFKGSTNLISDTSNIAHKGDQNTILKYLSAQISKYIDVNFVNSNQDLRNEIYLILKYNELNNGKNVNKMKITYIPPDDMIHVYFKKDPETHRGISDLQKALFPATLYSAMYITNAIWTLTRSQDKRIYYVKQTVETNISKTLLNTVNQIKRGNMNIRQIDNVNHILGITGQFNDYIVPRSQSGESPIDFEVLNGQQIEYKTEFMTMLEETAVNTTDIPLEMIQMRQSVEYATQLSMSSSKTLRKVYNRQAKFQPFCTTIFTKLYSNEFADDSVSFEIKLPPPMFLNITNTNQMINNVSDYSSSIADIMLDEEDEQIKKYVIKEINKANLGTYLDLEYIQNTINLAKQYAERDNDGTNNEEQ